MKEEVAFDGDDAAVDELLFNSNRFTGELIVLLPSHWLDVAATLLGLVKP